MFVKKQIYFLASAVIVLSLALISQQVFAQWSDPVGPPDGGGVNPPLTNPLQSNLDLDNNNIINVDKMGLGGVTDPTYSITTNGSIYAGGTYLLSNNNAFSWGDSSVKVTGNAGSGEEWL